jgi:hypothetical protein
MKPEKGFVANAPVLLSRESITMNIPALELRRAEKKCNILAELDEDFGHVIDKLERRYGVKIRVQVIRPVVGGGAGPERIIISVIEELDAQFEETSSAH